VFLEFALAAIFSFAGVASGVLLVEVDQALALILGAQSFTSFSQILILESDFLIAILAPLGELFEVGTRGGEDLGAG
jgi:hypothetical protein